MKFEIQTHGTGGKWGPVSACRKNWSHPAATNLGEALAVCKAIKGNGYGVRLFSEGELILSAPWQVPVEFGLIVEI